MSTDPPDDPASPAAVDRLARELRERGERFVRATVVRREPPVSANVGDRAVVTADGDLRGWIGGAACARSVVAREAAEVLESGEARLVGLAPEPEAIDRPGVDAYPMTCHSGGTLEVFLEPVVPTRELVVVGDSPIAAALGDLATDLAFDVVAVGREGPDDGGDDGNGERGDARAVTEPTTGAIVEAATRSPYVVVASMGEYDVAGVAAGIALEAPYVGLVASDRRATEVAELVADQLDAPMDAVREAVTAPAGVDIGAETPEEIAVSILAELVAARRGAAEIEGSAAVEAATDAPGADGNGAASTAAATGDTTVDPVCGMTVASGEATATVEFEGETYRFCSEGCADSFERDPGEYLDLEPNA